MLDAMQRLYTRDQYLERVSWMKEAKREISLTSDVIVGFPGETEQDFDLEVLVGASQTGVPGSDDQRAVKCEICLDHHALR